MRLCLGVPVFNRKDVTAQFIEQLNRSVVDPTSLHLVIVDNGSDPAYEPGDVPKSPFHRTWLRVSRNVGFYEPLRLLVERYDDEIIALVHNDLFIYEEGWDRRLRAAFANDEELGIVGVCGSPEVDSLGGRGAGTVCHFRGTPGLGQSQAAGRRVTDLVPVAILDSMFMAFRREVAEAMVAGERPTPAHFYDKIWPMRAIEQGWRVAVLGIEVDHLGGTTLVAEPKFWADMARWCQENGVSPGENPTLAIYQEAERRWLTEFRDQKRLIPGALDGWTYRPS